MFKVGDEITCIDNAIDGGVLDSLTVGKNYKVLGLDECDDCGAKIVLINVNNTCLIIFFVSGLMPYSSVIIVVELDVPAVTDFFSKIVFFFSHFKYLLSLATVNSLLCTPVSAL